MSPILKIRRALSDGQMAFEPKDIEVLLKEIDVLRTARVGLDHEDGYKPHLIGQSEGAPCVRCGRSGVDLQLSCLE